MKKGGLGKGVGALLGNIENVAINKNEEQKEEKLQENFINIALIEANKEQPRKNFKKEEMDELINSIKEYGIIQPILLKRIGKKYEIVAGERRWRAAKALGLKKIPAIIKEYDDRLANEISLIENIQRENLNPIEEALAYKSLIDEYDLTQDELAKKIAKNRTTVTNALRLLRLSEAIQKLIIEDKISQGHARALLAIEDEELQNKLAMDIVKNELSVRELERLIKNLNKKPGKKREKVSDELDIFYEEYEEKIRQLLGTQVHINRKDRTKGKIEIEYYSNEEFERILEIFNLLR